MRTLLNIVIYVDHMYIEKVIIVKNAIDVHKILIITVFFLTIVLAH
jgi:hypothetical protein